MTGIRRWRLDEPPGADPHAGYDMTTIRAAGLSEQDGDVRKFGMSKEGLIARQVMLGVVQTADVGADRKLSHFRRLCRSGN